VPLSIVIRPLREDDLDAADRIFRLAFGTFMRLPDPTTFAGRADPLRMRWRAEPSGAFVAEQDGRIVGSNLAVRWGSVGFFGPLSVDPSLWDQGLGQRLMAPIVDTFAAWDVRLAGLFTFPESTKHVGLYQRFGFFPKALTIILSRPPAPADDGEFETIASDDDVAQCREITERVYRGLDLTSTIRHIATHGLGETVVVRDGGHVDGFAVCYCGPGGDADTGECFVKFGAVRPGADASSRFMRLLDAIDRLAIARNLRTVLAGMGTARLDAYRLLLARGFRGVFHGVTMTREGDVGYDVRDAFVIDDWR
jgi:predicted N-acetyltransferase YhbS